VITDINALGQSDYTMYKHDMEVYRRKFESEGFATEVIDGHDVAAVLAALDRAKATKGRPQAIIARTVKGHGFSLVAGKRAGTASRSRRATRPRQLKNVVELRWFLRIRGNPTRGPPCPRLRIFQHPPLPEYAADAQVCYARGVWFRAKTPGKSEPAHRCMSALDVMNSTSRKCSTTKPIPDHFLSGLYIAEQNLVSTGVGLAARGKVPFSIPSPVSCHAPMTTVRRPPLAAQISIVRIAIVEFPLEKTAHRRWRSKIIAMFRAISGSEVFYPAMPYPPSA